MVWGNRPGQQQDRPAAATAGDQSAAGPQAPQPPSPAGGGALSNPVFSGDHVLETIAKGGALLRPGARGPAVRAVQQFLINEGHDLGRWGADGAWGKQTTQAVKAWQSENGLSADGVIGPNTLSAMDGAAAGPSPNAEPTPSPAPTATTPAGPATPTTPTAPPAPTAPVVAPVQDAEQDADADADADANGGGDEGSFADFEIPAAVSNLNLREHGSKLNPILGGGAMLPGTQKRSEVFGVQRAVSALGHDPNGIDGQYGDGLKGALEELQREENLLEPGQQAGHLYARTLAYLDLNAPMHPQVLRNTQINYDKLYSDKLVEFGLFVGYDEGHGGHWTADVSYARRELQGMGFEQDNAGAEAAYAESGRPYPGAPGEYWVHNSYANYLGKSIKGVFRLTHSDMGPDVADAYADSLRHGEVTMYSGHGRYGSGPDFDKNYTIKVNGQVSSYEHCKHFVKDQLGNPGASNAALRKKLRELHAAGIIEVTGHNAGNMVMNDQDVQGSFGSALMYLAVENGADGSNSRERFTADYNETATDNYKVWMFDGCSTSNYTSSIRRDVTKEQATVMGTGTSITMCTSMELVRGMMTQQSGQQIAKAMDASHEKQHPGGAKGGGKHFVNG